MYSKPCAVCLALRPGPAGVVDQDVEAVPAASGSRRPPCAPRPGRPGRAGTTWTSSFQVRWVTSLAAASALAWLRQASTVVAPWAATPTAVSRPMPDVGPGDDDDLALHAHAGSSLEPTGARGSGRVRSRSGEHAVRTAAERSDRCGPWSCQSGSLTHGRRVGQPRATDSVSRPWAGAPTMTIVSSPTLDALLLQVLITPEGQADPYPLLRADARGGPGEPHGVRAVRRQRLRGVPGRAARPAARSGRGHRGHVDRHLRRRGHAARRVLRAVAAQHAAGRPAGPHPAAPPRLALVHARARSSGCARPSTPWSTICSTTLAETGRGGLHGRLRAAAAHGGHRRARRRARRGPGRTCSPRSAPPPRGSSPC